MFLAILMLAVYAAARSWYDAAIYLIIGNIPIDFYPVILQRYDRFRLSKVIQRRDSGRWRAQPIDANGRKHTES